MSMRDDLGRVLCYHGRPIMCGECGEEYAREIDAPVIELPDKHPLRLRAEAAERQVTSLTAALAQKDAEIARMKALAKRATNGWACYATRNIEHDEIGWLHTEIDKPSPAVLPREDQER